MADFNDPKGDFNPYAPPAPIADVPAYAPQPEESPVEIPAERGTRFVARLADGALLMVSILPMVFGFVAAGAASGASHGSKGGLDALPTLPFALLVVPLALCIYQWNLIATQGQTLGKKWLGIKIVKIDGTPLGFVSGVVLRNWIVGMVANVPYVGFVFSIVNVLMIFGQDRRCLHDQIASTKVVLAVPGM